jgi:nitrogen fixation-related uncharacterized protein
MSIYYVFWVLLIVVSLSISLGGFVWAHRSGQFREQERARYLPLRDELREAPSGKGRGTGEVYILFAILAVGAAGLLAVAAIIILTAVGAKP